MIVGIKIKLELNAILNKILKAFIVWPIREIIKKKINLILWHHDCI